MFTPPIPGLSSHVSEGDRMVKRLAQDYPERACGQDPSPCLTSEPHSVSTFKGWNKCGQTKDRGPGARHTSPLRSAEHLEANTLSVSLGRWLSEMAAIDPGVRTELQPFPQTCVTLMGSLCPCRGCLACFPFRMITAQLFCYLEIPSPTTSLS